jgi:PAS domain S-box-containing protein
MDGSFDTTRNPVLVADDERRYVEANPAACALLGLSRDEIVGRRIDDFSPLAARERIDEVWRDFLARGGTTGRWPMRLPDGRELEIAYGAVANVAPGRHISIFLVAAPARSNGGVLTAREREVLALVAAGETSRSVAERLYLSPTTVESHIRSAMNRLGARNRPHAVALALARGELEPDGATG